MPRRASWAWLCGLTLFFRRLLFDIYGVVGNCPRAGLRHTYANGAFLNRLPNRLMAIVLGFGQQEQLSVSYEIDTTVRDQSPLF